MKKFLLLLTLLTGCFEDNTSLVIRAQQEANAWEYAKKMGHDILGCRVKGILFWYTQCELRDPNAGVYTIDCDNECTRSTN